jgi:hypothetical protein
VGSGGGSDNAWQALVTVDHQMNGHLGLRAGYGLLSADHEDEGNVHDATTRGPFPGLSVRFRSRDLGRSARSFPIRSGPPSACPSPGSQAS